MLGRKMENSSSPLFARHKRFYVFIKFFVLFLVLCLVLKFVGVW